MPKKRKRSCSQATRKKKQQKTDNPPCFICKETEVEHNECAPHGKCPTCKEVICTSCWWSYSNGTDACIFCEPDQRPENCPCDEIEACDCLENAKKGIRGHEPTWSEIDSWYPKW